MKKLSITIAVLFCLTGTTSAFAGGHLVNAIWTTNVYMGNAGYSGLYANAFNLDIGIADSFYTLNGIAELTNGNAIPCTGTGYYTVAGTYAFGMSCGTMSAQLTLNGQTLNGTVKVLSDSNPNLGNGYLTLYGVY